jgi:hypothetical protein
MVGVKGEEENVGEGQGSEKGRTNASLIRV